MKISLSGLPLPDRAKAANIRLASAPRYLFFDGKLVAIECEMESEEDPSKTYLCSIFQDPPEYFCECGQFTFRKKFCKHLSRLFLLTHNKETFKNVKK